MSRIAAGLPSNPRARIGRTAEARGIPEGQHPTLRSVSSTRPSQVPAQRKQVQVAIPNHQPVEQNRSLRTARSVPSIHVKQGPPQVQDTNTRHLPSRPNDIRHAQKSGDSESESATSSVSSFWDQSKSSQRSSTTTLPSDDDMEYKAVGREESSGNESYIDASFVWGRVTGAASVLTQEVTKAWTVGLAPLGNRGGEDNASAESHLVKVMRAYHLSKARTPEELPNWLFSERERGKVGTLAFDPPPSQRQVPGPAQPSERRNRRDIDQSDRPKASDPWIFHGRNLSESRVPLQPRPTGTDRLKMMRELRRNAQDSGRI